LQKQFLRQIENAQMFDEISSGQNEARILSLQENNWWTTESQE
jgi:hypothetical protein